MMPPTPGGTAGKAHDNGTALTTVGLSVGIVEAVSGSYTLPDGISVTLSITEPLIMLRLF